MQDQHSSASLPEDAPPSPTRRLLVKAAWTAPVLLAIGSAPRIARGTQGSYLFSPPSEEDKQDEQTQNDESAPLSEQSTTDDNTSGPIYSGEGYREHRQAESRAELRNRWR